MSDGRVSLSSDLQFKMFDSAMATLYANSRQLSDYDRELFQKLRDGFSYAGRDLTVSVKQMNHIKQVAFELDKGDYHAE